MQPDLKTEKDSTYTRINIAYVIPTLSLEGPGIILRSIISNLDRMKYNVIVCTLIRPKKIKTIASIKKDLIDLEVKIFEFHLLKPFDVANILLLWRIFRKCHIQIVHTHLIRGHIYGRIAARLAKIPITVSTIHAMDYWKKSRNVYHRISTQVDKWTTRFADKIVTVSDAAKRYIEEIQGVPSGKIITIYNGIDMNKFSKSVDISEKKRELNLDPHLPVVGVISRLDKRKGIESFLRTASVILKSQPNIQFMIVGDGSLRISLRNLAHDLNIERKVFFTGFRTDIPEILACFDILVMTSETEGFGLPLIEAMAMARPVIAMNIGPVKELIIHNETGLIIPAQDPKALYESILTLLSSEWKRKKMGLNGQNLVKEKFSSVQMAKGYDNLYSLLLDKTIT